MIRATQWLTLTTDGAGAASGYCDPFTGRVLAIEYVKTDYATGVDFTITKEDTAENIWTEVNQDATITDYPRVLLQSVVGADLSAVYDAPVVAGRVSFAVAAGGAAKVGKFRVIYDDGS